LTSLPYGVGAPKGASPRVVVAIGDYALDLAVCAEAGLLGPDAPAAGVWRSDSLNGFLGAGPDIHRAVRRRLQDLLRFGAAERDQVERHLHLRQSLVMGCPVAPPDFADFYASFHHAVRAMSANRWEPVTDVEPNWKAMPVGYHSRSGTIVGTDAPITRPSGQYRSNSDVVVRPSQALDFELEVGLILGRGSQPGQRVPTQAFPQHAFGLTLLNDWSARDLQRWESFPLGPFTAKSFASQLGPWVVPIEAFLPFGHQNETQGQAAAAYLRHQEAWTFDVELEAHLQSAEMRRRDLPPLRITLTNLRHMYWDPAQLLAHLTVNGASTRPGDLLGSGTISGPDLSSAACLLELTNAGKALIQLPDGTSRGWLQDGDEVTLSGAVRQGGAALVSLGELRGRVAAAVPF
jgi:fumarylacetoacetase